MRRNGKCMKQAPLGAEGTKERSWFARKLDTQRALAELRWFVHWREEECSLKRHSERKRKCLAFLLHLSFNLKQTSKSHVLQ